MFIWNLKLTVLETAAVAPAVFHSFGLQLIVSFHC